MHIRMHYVTKRAACDLAGYPRQCLPMLHHGSDRLDVQVACRSSSRGVAGSLLMDRSVPDAEVHSRFLLRSPWICAARDDDDPLVLNAMTV